MNGNSLRGCVGQLAIAALLSIMGGCSGSDGQLILNSPNTELQSDDAGDISMAANGAVDFARGLFSVNTPWDCLVLGGATPSTDAVLFHADGRASFGRYGAVFWNRDLSHSTLSIHTVDSRQFEMHSIFASSETLQFNVKFASESGSAGDEVYDCALSVP